MIAIDDFASGASSLQNLTRLTIDFLKIAPRLIADIGINKKVEGFISAL
jgi:EAL domain-containing protein (putative c-di-GMP-specific phosphodiesterase class I)